MALLSFIFHLTSEIAINVSFVMIVCFVYICAVTKSKMFNLSGNDRLVVDSDTMHTYHLKWT